MGDFNGVIGEDPKMMAQVITTGRLTDVHGHKHEHHTNIATYIRDKRRVDYCFVSPRIIDHVIRCGSEAFHARKKSDHRGYFVDLSMIGLFDRRLLVIVNPAEKCIWSSHPRLVRKYIEKLSDYFKDHNIVRKVTEIQHTYNYEEVEKLDKLITTGILHVERECRHNVRLPWSNEIHKTMPQVNILRIHMSSLRNNIDYSNQIEKKQQSLKVEQYLPTTRKETTELLKDAQKQVQIIWKEYQSKRTTLLEDQEETYVTSCPNICPEMTARIFKNFKISSGIYSELPTKRHKGGGLSTIEASIPKEGETLEYQTLIDTPMIEKEILRRKIQYFRQAENTPLAGKGTIDSIGFGVTTTTADEILKGTADIDAIINDPTSKKLFEIFKPELKIMITEEKMMDRYKSWNKRTATLPSSRHLGHYHALFRPFKYENRGDKKY